MKFSTAYARYLRRKAARPDDVWHLDEVRVVILGKPHWLWRSVDQGGYIFDEILEIRRNTKAARLLLTGLLKRQRVRSGRMITDKLESYGAARRKMYLSIRHLSHKGLNKTAENSHLYLRKRERNYAEIPLTRRVSALRLCLFGHSYSLRPIRLYHHRLFPEYPSYQGLRSVG